MSSIKTASVLAFERKLSNSDGLMYSGSWENRNDNTQWSPIPLQLKAIRGTISNRLKSPTTFDPLKLDADIQKANLQTVDIAALPFNRDTVKLVFTLKVLGNISIPTTCNNQEYQNALVQKIGAYLDQEQCRELSLRYAENLANGRFFWRNRIGAEEIEVRISVIKKGEFKDTMSFNSLQFNLRQFDNTQNPMIQKLSEYIRAGLMGESYTLLQIEAFARLGLGQEVFPSQELVRDFGGDKYQKSKFLYAVNETAALHSQKIGNALRTIDTWYSETVEAGPIAVEPFGSVTSRGAAYRQPKAKKDFYTLFDNWIIKDTLPTIEQQHYVVACLIRGGVFGEKEKE